MPTRSLGPKGLRLTLVLTTCVLVPTLLARRANAAQVTVPVDLGVAPAFYHGLGPAFADAPGHFGVKLSVAAIIDQAMIRKHIRRVPKQYRKMALGMREFRYRPSIFIPDALIISPKVGKTGMYGITWRPMGLSIPLVSGGVRASVGAGLILTYAFLHSDNAAFAPSGGAMHFLRPGLDVGPRVEIPVTDNFLISFGWVAQLYIPQSIGGGVFDIPALDDPAALDQSLWFMGQAWLMLHFRFPYTTHI